MADIPLPVKPFAAVLHSDLILPEQVVELLTVKFGPLDYQGKPHPFDVTDYYAPEMGAPLFRTLVSFENLIDASALPAFKIRTIAVEDVLRSASGGRSVNIDSGYLDFDKMVLASTKRGPYKIYMSDQIWADMTLHYEKGHFLPFAWSFADFKDNRYEADLLRIRERYKKAITALSASG